VPQRTHRNATQHPQQAADHQRSQWLQRQRTWQQLMPNAIFTAMNMASASLSLDVSSSKLHTDAGMVSKLDFAAS
jgi:hypothetical protein